MRLGINGRFHQAPVTGVQRYAHEVAGRLQRLVPTTLFLPAPAAAPQLAADTVLVRGRLGAHAFEQLELPRLARRAGCNVMLHLAGTSPLTSRHDVIVIHDVLPLTHPHWFGRRFRGWRSLVLRRTAPSAARIVTVTRWSAGEIARTLGVDPTRIVVTPQGVAPFDRPAARDQTLAVLARLALGRPFLLAVGAGDPRKNHAFLGEVLNRWHERQPPPPPLVLVGSPPRRLFADDAAWSRGLDVRWLGHVDDATLHALYTGAAALCYPSVAEGYGRPPLEALACGTPAVVADYPCAREVLGGRTPILPLTVDTWVHVLRGLVEDGLGGRPESCGASASINECDTAAEVVLRACGASASINEWDTAADVVLRACEGAFYEARRGGRR